MLRNEGPVVRGTSLSVIEGVLEEGIYYYYKVFGIAFDLFVSSRRVWSFMGVI